MAVKPARKGPRADLTTLIGVPLAVGLVVVGQALEGGSLGSVLQLTAALIVFGGTAGAVLVSFPQEQIMRACGARNKAGVDFQRLTARDSWLMRLMSPKP